MSVATSHPVLDGSPYAGYVYSYPHKTAYRPLTPKPLADVWAKERRNHLFLYIHVPFCTMRCGFCNLFTTANPSDNLVLLYLDALRRQAEVVRAAVPDVEFARFAIGGGTPTYLSEAELETLFDIAETGMGLTLSTVAASVETSPDTLTSGKVDLFARRNVERVSIGVQSFIDAEVKQAGRSQSKMEVEAALALLIGRFPTVNVDLMYGLPEQTVESWLESVRIAAEFGPEELYLYPLYVRPLTGLGRSQKRWDDWRLSCYREARAFLLAEGYRQVSMRMFRKAVTTSPPNPLSGTERGRENHPLWDGEGGPLRGPREGSSIHYCCQEDGMIGLGSGSRSYTWGLHYSFDYAVAAGGVRGIIADYLSREPQEFAVADQGFELDDDERRRRYLLQSVLNVDGLDEVRYQTTFGTVATDDFPDLFVFRDLGLLDYHDRRWIPTPLGLERSDALGPWFFSDQVRRLMQGYEPQ